MARLALAAVLIAVAVLMAWLVQRRRGPSPLAPTFAMPAHVDRTEFPRPDAPWLVVAFTSASCDTCADVVKKVRALESDMVAVREVEARADKAVHDRYGVDAVPLVVVADEGGTVKAHFFGPVPASDLWAALAELRNHP